MGRTSICACRKEGTAREWNQKKKHTRNSRDKEELWNFQRRSQQGTSKASSFSLSLFLIFLTHILWMLCCYQSCLHNLQHKNMKIFFSPFSFHSSLHCSRTQWSTAQRNEKLQDKMFIFLCVRNAILKSLFLQEFVKTSFDSPNSYVYDFFLISYVSSSAPFRNDNAQQKTFHKQHWKV